MNGELLKNGVTVADVKNIKIHPGRHIIEEGTPVGKDPDQVTFEIPGKPHAVSPADDYSLKPVSGSMISITPPSRNGSRYQAYVQPNAEDIDDGI